MRVVYFGSGAFGLPTLRHLAEHHTLTGIITQPDRPAGRGGRSTPTPIAEWAAANLPAVPLLRPERIRDVVDSVRALPADAWVVIAYGQKLPAPLLADRFAINLHASRLPRWRGAAPINAAVLAGDPQTGNSVIALADRMDAGVVYAQSLRDIHPDHTAGDLHDLLAADGPALVESVLSDFAAGRLAPVAQDDALVTIAPKLSRSDAGVNFADTARACRQKVHGLTPWPSVSVLHRGEALKLLRVQAIASEHHASPGVLVDALNGVVACGQGSYLRLVTVQPAGKRAMPWLDYANGRHVQTGEIIAAHGPS